MLPQIKRAMESDMSKVTQHLKSRLTAVIPVLGMMRQEKHTHFIYKSFWAVY